jgi:hypothetical protein
MFVSTQYGAQLRTPYEHRKLFPQLDSNQAGVDGVYKEVTALCDELRRLNVLCVSLQYKHHHEGTLDAEIKTETDDLLTNKAEKKDLTILGLYNALRCIRYQIETEHLKDLRGLTPEENKAVTFANFCIDELAHLMVSNLPEDTSCHWSL